MKEHIKIALQWGLIGGLGMAIFRFVIYLIAPLSIGKWDNAYYLPLLFCMVWAAVTVKRNQGGEITFGRVFTITLIITLIGAVINTFFAFILFKWIDPDLGVRLYNLVLETAQDSWDKQGYSQAQRDAAKKMIDLFLKSPVGILLAMTWQLFIGTIISLLISGFVKHKDPSLSIHEDSNSAT